MLQFFRKMMNSRVGVILALVFLALIALAFASADVSNTNTFGGVGGGDRVATVGKQRIDASALSQAATTSLENLKRDNPRLSMTSFLAEGGLNQVLDQLIDRTALGEFGRKYGIVASDRLIDSEITKLEAFKGPDGKFSEAAFRQALQQRGISEKLVREDLGQGLIARQILVPAAFGAVAPHELTSRYATLLRESRAGTIAVLPAAAFAPKTPPTAAELSGYYDRNKSRFIRPERRIIRYAVFGEDAIKATATAPTEAEIAAAFAASKAQYVAQETRRITQLIVPTEAAARAIVSEVTDGKPLEAAASAKGLSAAAIGPMTREALSGDSSPAVAAASFAAPRGKVAALARSGLGWHVMRIDAIVTRPARTLDQARPEIVARLTEQKRRVAISDMSARIEDEFDKGGNLSDTAKELGVTLQSTQPMTADGQLYGAPGTVAPEVARVAQAAFAMEGENRPQLAEIQAGKTFIIYDVTRIEPSAPAPLKEIGGDVATALMLEKGMAGARAAADRVAAQARTGTDLGAALAALAVALPPVDRVEMGREQLMSRGQQVPPPLALLFSMAKGTVKLLPAPGNRGWYVVALKDVVPGKIAPNDPMIAAAQRELGLSTGREYADALRRAISAELGVQRNQTAIKAVRKQLDGGS